MNDKRFLISKNIVNMFNPWIFGLYNLLIVITKSIYFFLMKT